MFFLRPNASWQTQGIQDGIRPFRGGAEQRGPLSSLFFSLSPRQNLQRGKAHRRASDQLGLRPQMKASTGQPFFVSTPQQAAQSGRLIIDYLGDEWRSPEENMQLGELTDNAERLVSDLAQSDRDLAALSQQAATGMITPDLSMIAQQTFARIDELMHGWNVRADELDRTTSTAQWQPVNPATGMRYENTPALRRSPRPVQNSGRIVAQHQYRASPGAQPVRGGDQRQGGLRADFSVMRLLAPSPHVRQRRQKLADQHASSQVVKADSLRQQLNLLASRSTQTQAGGLRRIAMARLAGLHETIDHMAFELHEYRQQLGNSMNMRLDRRRAPRAAAMPAPVYKPKIKDETST